MRGLDCLLSIGGNAVAAQMDASLSRATRTGDVTDRIAMTWENYLPGLRSWSVVCQGAYVVSDAALIALEDAFANGEVVDIELGQEGHKYKGQGIITSFPIGATYNKDVTYSINLQGKGALERE